MTEILGPVQVRRPRAKLTEEQVREIRESTDPQDALAKTYGVTQQTISDIKRRRNWKRVS